MHLQIGPVDRYQHVVFADRCGGTARVVNLAPQRGRTSRSYGIPAQLTEEQEQFVRSLLACAGLDARAYRPESVQRRIRACLRALGASSILEARRALAATPALVHVAVNALVIGVSSFFRDGRVFEELAFHVLPALCGPRRPARVWSVGCADGQELYSVAILLAELNLLDGCYLLGTDCRADAIRRAREGCFDEAAMRPVPAPWVERYFARHDGHSRRIVRSLRTAVQWRTADVTRVEEPGLWDLILCRNMAMYLRPEASGKLWATFERALRPGGYLVLGKAERPTGARRLSPLGPCLYRRDRG